MKTKFLLFLLCALSFNISAQAQIIVEESFDNDLILIGNLSANEVLNALGSTTTKLPEHKLYCRIWQDKVTYGILVATSNRFDDDFEFALGTDIDKAKESINTILTFMKDSDLGKSIKVVDEDKRKIQLDLQKRKFLMLSVVDSDTNEIICDKVVLTRNNFEKAISLLDSKAEKVVAKELAKNKEKNK